MPKRGDKQPKYPPMDTSDKNGPGFLIKEFSEWLLVKGFSESTVENRLGSLRYFFIWVDMRGIRQPREVTKPVLERYQRYLYHYRKKNGEPLSFQTQNARLAHIRNFYRWLAKGNYILSNPASDLDLPRMEKRLPRSFFTAAEADAVINQANLATPIGIRDRAIMETFYSTGIRRSELARLKVFDLDSDRETLLICDGKGKKDRMVPIGDRALHWIHKYLREVRPLLAIEPDEGFIFLTKDGLSISLDFLTIMVKRYVEAARIRKRGSCHIFRHTMATLMLEGGADIRYIQQMLGHSRLETTQIYTQVTLRKLRAVFLMTHPGATLNGKPPPEAEEETDEE
ncbi:MAG: site-specific tyrosine recombinase XerC [Candidatus Riflebacteria bacterium]|nr:site-specific tyrosine recombinase XerC [Candidatus Riflebacteria bacterium]